MIKPRKIPLRICVGCKERKPKKSLIRVVSIPEGDVEIDLTGKKSGRGVYICPDRDCLSKASRGKRLEKNLKKSIPAEVINKLSDVLDEISEKE